MRSRFFWRGAASVSATGKSARTSATARSKPRAPSCRTRLKRPMNFAHVGNDRLPAWTKQRKRVPMQRRRALPRTAVRRWRLDTVPVSGRPAASRLEWQAIQSQVRSRAGWRCEACGRRGRLDVHHIIKRSRGGSDFDLDHLVALCRACHDQTDAPLVAGRLMVTPLGDGRFGFEVMYGPAKYRWP